MPTYKDIQRLTGLSLATISKYYSGGNVRAENRAAIERAASELDYRVNTVASNLRSGRSGTVGVLLPSLANAFHMSIIDGVERDLRAQGISVVVTSTAGESPEQRSVDLLLGRMVDAIVAVPDTDVVPGLRDAIAAGVPVVCVDWKALDLDSDQVTLDNGGAGRLAAQLLLDHGHRRIALIGGPDTVSTMHDRAVGFVESLLDAGSRPLPEDLLSGPLTIEHGHRAMRTILAQRTRPTAVFTVNYELTVGALIALNESGLRLGRDVSMVGFDNTDIARIANPRLTVIAQPVDDIARAVADIVRIRLAGEAGTAPITRSLSAALVSGTSVAALHDASHR